MEQRISLIAPGVSDVSRAETFYRLRSREEVEAVIEQARLRGATIRREPGEIFWGCYDGTSIDPDCHSWEVARNPDWTLHANGMISLE